MVAAGGGSAHRTCGERGQHDAPNALVQSFQGQGLLPGGAVRREIVLALVSRFKGVERIHEHVDGEGGRRTCLQSGQRCRHQARGKMELPRMCPCWRRGCDCLS